MAGGGSPDAGDLPRVCKSRDLIMWSCNRFRSAMTDGIGSVVDKKRISTDKIYNV